MPAITSKETPEDVEFDVHREDISAEELIETYSKWGEEYEQDLRPEIYLGPQYIAQHVANVYGKSNSDIKILDVAAGTGFLGQKLLEQGFTNIDALEPSQGMTQVASKKQIYNQFICELLEDKNSIIQDDSYDCLVCSGGFGPGHIPCSAIKDMIRMVKPGGHIFLGLREEFLWTVNEYKDRLEPEMQQLENKGKWKKVGYNRVEKFFYDKDGIVYVYQVL